MNAWGCCGLVRLGLGTVSNVPDRTGLVLNGRRGTRVERRWFATESAGIY